MLRPQRMNFLSTADEFWDNLQTLHPKPDFSGAELLRNPPLQSPERTPKR
jgi:hypothetical protein